MHRTKSDRYDVRILSSNAVDHRGPAVLIGKSHKRRELSILAVGVPHHVVTELLDAAYECAENDLVKPEPAFGDVA